MVAAVRDGDSFRSVARRFHVGLATLHYWVRRTRRQRLDRVEWSDRPPILITRDEPPPPRKI